MFGRIGAVLPLLLLGNLLGALAPPAASAPPPPASADGPLLDDPNAFLGEILGPMLPGAGVPDGLLSRSLDPWHWTVPWALLDPDRPHATRDLEEDETYGGPGYTGPDPVVIDTDWVVPDGVTLTFHAIDVRFDGPHMIKVLQGGTLISDGDSFFRKIDLDTAKPGVILSRGGTLDLQGGATNELRFRNVAVTSYDAASGEAGTTTIRNAWFNFTAAGLVAGHSGVTATRSSFTNNGVGVLVGPGYRKDGATLDNDPRFEELTLVGNYIGYSVMSGVGTEAERPGLGRLEESEFEANTMGAFCQSNGTNPQAAGPEGRPRFVKNNFLGNMAEGYSGQVGFQVDKVDIEIPDSACYLKDNYWGKDTHYKSLKDYEEQPIGGVNEAWNIANPESPVAVTRITDSQTWTDRTLSGPVIVKKNGILTLRGTTRQAGYLMGSVPDGADAAGAAQAGGKILADGATIHDPAVVFRSNQDDADQLTLEGEARFGFALTQYRHANTFDDFKAEGLEGVAHFASSALFVEAANQWTATFNDPVVEDTTAFSFAVGLSKVTIHDGKFDDVPVVSVALLGSVEAKRNWANNTVIGLVAGLSTANVGVGLTTEDNHWDRGGIGQATIVTTASTFTHDTFSALNAGVLTFLDAPVPTITELNLTYNSVGIVGIGVALAPATTNFVHNYHAAFYMVDTTVTLDDPVNPDEEITEDVPASMNCNVSCYWPEDEAWVGTNLAPNPIDEPNDLGHPHWDGNERIADGDAAGNEEIVLDGATLDGPALARRGGVLRLTNAVLEGDWYPIGTKAGGNGDFDVGVVDIEAATLRDVGFVALNGTGSLLTRSEFDGGGGVIPHWDPPALICNRFFDASQAIRYARGVDAAELEVRRHRFDTNHKPLFNGSLQLSVDAAGSADSAIVVGLVGRDKVGVQHATIEQNYAGERLKLADRFATTDGDVQIHQNNLHPKSSIADHGKDDADPPVPVDVRNNWWGDATGPTHEKLNPDGRGAALVYTGPRPLIENPGEFRATEFELQPCASFRHAPETPEEARTVTFTDLSFGLTEDALASRVWDWGHDGETTTATARTVTHEFPDDGTFVVTLTVTTPGGTTDTFQRSIEVTNRPPVAAFDWSPAEPDDATPVQFADASTDPAPGDEIVAWSWDFGHDGETATGAEVTHTFPDDGAYDVRLTVEDDDGGTNSLTRRVTVPNAPPVAAFDYAPASPDDATAVTFTDASTDPSPSGSLASRSWDFGDGTTASGAQTTHTFADDGAYTVRLTVEDDDGATDSEERTVVVGNAPPRAAFNWSPSDLDDTTLVRFQDDTADRSPSGSIAARAWDFGDGATSDLEDPTHAYADDGEYTVRLTVTDDEGATETAEETLTVRNAGPGADFDWSPREPQPGDEVAFTDGSEDPSPNGALTAWSWDFGDGETSDVQNPTHTYASSGDYAVRLRVTDDDGATHEATRTVVVNRPPSAGFTWSPAIPVVDDTTSFEDLSTDEDGSVVAWSWDFGDGATSALRNPQHSFASAGTYAVTLRITDDDDATDETGAQILVNEAPEAAFSWAPAQPAPDEAVALTDGSTDADGSITSWAWDFGDGATSAVQNPTHAFEESGDYTVRLTVTDDQGATAQVTHILVVNQVPSADFAYSPQAPDVETAIQFEDLSSDSDGSIVAWSWDFGDGATSALANPTHAYAAHGTYAVTLRVTDDDDATAQATRTIPVNAPPSPAFTWAPEKPATDEDVAFTDASSDSDGTIEAWSWDFGDGTTSSSPNPTHSFVEVGDYAVRLTVTDDQGSARTVEHLVEVNRPPTADFTWSPALPVQGDLVQFEDLSTDPDGSVSTWAWDFGDGSTSTLQDPGHAYGDDGSYTVTLTVEDDQGASASRSKTIEVDNAPPTAAFTYGLGSKTVSFDAAASSDPGGDALTYSWDFGDGSTGSGVAPSRTYARAGEYTVRLTVNDGEFSDSVSHGIVATCTAALNVLEDFEDEALGNPNAGCWYEQDLGGTSDPPGVRETQWEVKTDEPDGACYARGARSVAMSYDCSPNGDYGENENDRLVSPFYDLSGVGAQAVTLTYYDRYLMGLDGDPEACVYVAARKSPDDPWQELSSECGSDVSWTQDSNSLNDFRGKQLVQVRYRFVSEAEIGIAGKGFFLDDVKVKTN